MYVIGANLKSETNAKISGNEILNENFNGIKVSSISNTPNNFIVTESLNNESISAQEEPIYLDMNKESIYQDMKGNNDIKDDYNDYMELDDSDESEIEKELRIKRNKNKEKPSFPPINQDRKNFLLEKVKLELAEHLLRIAMENNLKVSKDNLLLLLRKSSDLFSGKYINSDVFKCFMHQFIVMVTTSNYDEIKENEIFKNSFISYVFLYSYIFNKKIENNQNEFFMEDFSKIEKLNEFKKDKLYVDIIEVICDNIIDKDEVSCLLSTILERSKLIKHLDSLRDLICIGKGKNIQEKENKYDSIKNIIEEGIKKLNKENRFNKIELSGESKFKVLQEILKSKEMDSIKICEQLSEIIVDKSQLKKKMFNFLSDKLNDIPIELLVINENRKFTKCIIESFVYSLKKNNMIKGHDKVDLYDKIDYQLQSIYQNIDL